jgi:hypothetical protein
MILRGAFGLAIGSLAGVVVAGGLVATGALALEGPRGVIMHYIASATIVALLALPERLRPGARPVPASVLLALLATFVLRRWLSVWVNLAPLDLGSGPAGRLAAVALPLTGALLGAVSALDSGGRGYGTGRGAEERTAYPYDETRPPPASVNVSRGRRG